MKFPYRAIITTAPDGDDYLIVLRPEIPVTIVGPAGSGTYVALVDTGSDHTILPKSIADDLGIAVERASGTPASVFGGHQVELLMGESRLQLHADNESASWRSVLFFYDFKSREDETLILGHTGFLEYFTAIFDGKEGALTLLANDQMPH